MSSWQPAPDSGEGEPRRLAESLDRTARAMGAPGANVMASVFVHWEEAVGPGVAAHARPVSLTRGTLVVEVEDPAWATQLRYLGADILNRLCGLVDERVAERIEVRVSRGGAVRRPPRPEQETGPS